MTKPIITLKRLSTNERLSEETFCFTADLYVNGKLVGQVANRGCGGAHEFHIKRESGWTEESLNKACIDAFGTYEAYGMTLEHDLEEVVTSIVSASMELKSIKRKLKSKILTVEGGKIFSWSTPATHLEVFAKAHPTLTILNVMSDEQLLDVIRNTE